MKKLIHFNKIILLIGFNIEFHCFTLVKVFVGCYWGAPFNPRDCFVIKWLICTYTIGINLETYLETHIYFIKLRCYCMFNVLWHHYLLNPRIKHLTCAADVPILHWCEGIRTLTRPVFANTLLNEMGYWRKYASPLNFDNH